MVSTEFSEFTFGFAATRELVDVHGSGLVAPSFPSQQDEGILGYDVRLDDLVVPMFVQFKRPAHLIMRTANEWDLYRRDYYRFGLRTGSRGGVDQHALLVDLENRYPGQVLYLAPRWHSGRQMNGHYATGQILANSLAVHALAIGHLPQGARHVVVYTDERSDPVYRCSDPESVDTVDLPSVIDSVWDRLDATPLQRVIEEIRFVLDQHRVPIPSVRREQLWDVVPTYLDAPDELIEFELLTSALRHEVDTETLVHRLPANG